MSMRTTPTSLAMVATAGLLGVAVATGFVCGWCAREHANAADAKDNGKSTSRAYASWSLRRLLHACTEPCRLAYARVLLQPLRWRSQTTPPPSASSSSSGNASAATTMAAANSIRPVAPLTQRGYTPAQLRRYDGVHERRILVSLKGVVYEVSPQLYGPGQEYHVFAGKDVSRCLARHQLSDAEANKNWATCSAEELARLQEYVDRFARKYPVVGWLVPDDDFDKV